MEEVQTPDAQARDWESSSVTKFDTETLSSPLWFNKECEEAVSPLRPRIISIQTQRAAQMRVPESDSQDSEPEFHISVFYGIGGDAGASILLIGDLFAVKEGTLAGASTSCSISISSDQIVDDFSARAVGYWAAHALYDSTVWKWKELTSSSFVFSDVTLPEAPDAISISSFNMDEDEPS